jgi:hypothetical protein
MSAPNLASLANAVLTWSYVNREPVAGPPSPIFPLTRGDPPISSHPTRDINRDWIGKCVVKKLRRCCHCRPEPHRGIRDTCVRNEVDHQMRGLRRRRGRKDSEVGNRIRIQKVTGICPGARQSPRPGSGPVRYPKIGVAAPVVCVGNRTQCAQDSSPYIRRQRECTLVGSGPVRQPDGAAPFSLAERELLP